MLFFFYFTYHYAMTHSQYASRRTLIIQFQSQTWRQIQTPRKHHWTDFHQIWFGSNCSILPDIFIVSYFTGRPASIVFTQWAKNGFSAPQLRHIALINVKLGKGQRTACTLLHAKFNVYRGIISRRNVGIHPQNCHNFEFWPYICPSGATRLHNFYEILSVCTRL